MSRNRWCAAGFGVALVVIGREAVGQQRQAPIDLAPVVSDSLRVDRFTAQRVELPAGLPRDFEVTLDFDGAPETLRLEAYSLRSEAFQVLVQGDDGVLRPIEPSPPKTYRGQVVNQPGSRVAASLIDGKLAATILMEDRTKWQVRPLDDLVPGLAQETHAVYRVADIEPAPWKCGVEDAGLEAPPPTAKANGTATLHECDIAFDTDGEYYLLNGSSSTAVVDDIELVLNGVEAMYEAEVGITYALTMIVVRTSTTGDPYSEFDASLLLGEFIGEWTPPFGPSSGIPRDVAHLMTGRDLIGGVIGIAAGFGVICSSASGYALSQTRWSNNYVDRISLTAHELGHDWGATHCDGQPDCANMCATAGGCTGIETQFGASATSQIIAVRDAALCLIQPLTPIKPHLVWRHGGTGHNSLWVVDGLSVPLSGSLPAVTDKKWKIVASGDFNNDGFLDILWRRDGTGEVSIWNLRGPTVFSFGNLPKVADLNWKVAATGDFDGNGTSDILWRNCLTGANIIWFVSGISVTGWTVFSPVGDLNWTVVGTGDFNNDGKTDLLWRNEVTGKNILWFVCGTSIAGWGVLPDQPNTNWKVGGVGDVNGDGRPDIFWRHAVTGENAIWLVSGLTVPGWGVLPDQPNLNWKIVGIIDADRNGLADVLWRNAVTGENALWFVNGLSVVGWGVLPTVPDPEWDVVFGPRN